MPLSCAILYDVPSGSFLLRSVCCHASRAGCKDDTELACLQRERLSTRTWYQKVHSDTELASTPQGRDADGLIEQTAGPPRLSKANSML